MAVNVPPSGQRWTCGFRYMTYLAYKYRVKTVFPRNLLAKSMLDLQILLHSYA
jgi:hypothetical protein